MTNPPAIAAVDWGTTRLRIWLLDASGKVLAERRGNEGMLTAQATGFDTILERHLAAMAAPATLPAIVCGMAGSRQGWIEVPYVDTSAPIHAILKGAVRVPGQQRDIRIVPGLAQRSAYAPDVLRGEETQLAGAGMPAKGRHIACMPGTHSKWIVVEDGAITDFGTWPTGELFALLASQSILRHAMGDAPAPVSAANACFRRWCETALGDGGDFLSRLFAIRASSLLQGLEPDDAIACLSGLLIGTEIASVQRRFKLGASLATLIVSGPLGALYAAALGMAGVNIRQVDAENAVRVGLFAAAHHNGMV